MSIGEKSKQRGTKSIDPSVFIISSEGRDEVSYLENLKMLIPKRYNRYYQLIPVNRNVHDSSIQHVFNDLQSFIDSSKATFLKSANVEKYIVFDVDKNFQPNHVANTWQVIKEAQRSNVKILISNPSFEIWLILHFIGIHELADEIRSNLASNQSNFAKQFLAIVRNNIDMPRLVRLYKTALNNSKLATNGAPLKDLPIPPQTVISNFGLLIEDLQGSGILD